LDALASACAISAPSSCTFELLPVLGLVTVRVGSLPNSTAIPRIATRKPVTE